MALSQSSCDSSHKHHRRATFLRERAAHFKAQGDDEALNYAADLECEADEIDALLRHGAPDEARSEAAAS